MTMRDTQKERLVTAALWGLVLWIEVVIVLLLWSASGR